MGLARAVANEPNFFLIDGSKGGVSGAPKVYLAANEIEVPVELRAVQKDVYEAAYVPRLSGSYQVRKHSREETISSGKQFPIFLVERDLGRAPGERLPFDHQH